MPLQGVQRRIAQDRGEDGAQGGNRFHEREDADRRGREGPQLLGGLRGIERELLRRLPCQRALRRLQELFMAGALLRFERLQGIWTGARARAGG